MGIKIALDDNRDVATEIGLLLSAYAIIDLFIPHIFTVISGMSEVDANRVFSRVKGNFPRTELLRDLVASSRRVDKEKELQLLNRIDRATDIRNRYAHAIYSGVAASSTGWRMSLWQSDGKQSKKKVEDVSVASVRKDCAEVRDILESLYHFGSPTVQYE